MNQRDTQNSEEFAFLPSRKQYGRRVLALSVVWSAFGLIVGTVIAPPDAVGLVAYCLAGLIVLTPFGLLLGLVGGRWQETLPCGLIGLSLGALAGVWGNTEQPGFFAATGLVNGGIVGATFVNVFYRLPRLVIGFVKHSD